MDNLDQAFELEQSRRAAYGYLNRATRGLFGRKRAEVREELEAHVLERVHTLRAGGLFEEEALTRTLAELGDSAAICRGMLKVHVLPGVVTSMLVSVLAVAAVLAGMSTALTPRVEATNEVALYAQQLRVLLKSASSGGGSHQVSVSALRSALEREGVKITETGYGVDLGFPGGRPVSVHGVFAHDGQTHLPLGRLILEIADESGLPVKLGGWWNPRLTVGRTSFLVGTADVPVEAYYLYADILAQRLIFSSEGLGASSLRVGKALAAARPSANSAISHSRNDWRVHRLAVNDRGGGAAYAVLVWEGNGTVSLDLAKPTASGVLQFYLPGEPLTFARDFANFRGRPSRGAAQNAVLLRLTGRLKAGIPDFEVVVPEQPTTSIAL